MMAGGSFFNLSIVRFKAVRNKGENLKASATVRSSLYLIGYCSVILKKAARLVSGLSNSTEGIM